MLTTFTFSEHLWLGTSALHWPVSMVWLSCWLTRATSRTSLAMVDRMSFNTDCWSSFLDVGGTDPRPGYKQINFYILVALILLILYLFAVSNPWNGFNTHSSIHPPTRLFLNGPKPVSYYFNKNGPKPVLYYFIKPVQNRFLNVPKPSCFGKQTSPLIYY